MIVYHHGICSDSAICPNNYWSQNLSTSTDCYSIFNRRMALNFFKRTATESNAVIEHHIITYFGGLTNNDTHAMIDKKTPPNDGPWMDLDTGQKTGELREGTSERFRAVLLPKFVCKPVSPYRMHARIVKHDFASPTRRWIMLSNIFNVFAQTGKKSHNLLSVTVDTSPRYQHRSRFSY